MLAMVKLYHTIIRMELMMWAMDGSIKVGLEDFLSLVRIRNGIRVGGYGLDKVQELRPLGSKLAR